MLHNTAKRVPISVNGQSICDQQQSVITVVTDMYMSVVSSHDVSPFIFSSLKIFTMRSLFAY
jgi:hypothetical protein